MTEIYEHNPGDHEDPVPSSTWMVGLVGSIVLVIIMLGLTALTYNMHSTEFVAVNEAMAPKELKELTEQQQQRLQSWWQDKADPNHCGMPIERAMELFVQQQTTGSAPGATTSPATMH
jgi:hypothetical protein